MIPTEVLHELRARVDAVAVVRELVDLKKSGVQWRGCCPFHHEKKPSFYVHPKKGLYRCHGCGESGDAIRFVMRTRGLRFGDAVRSLAEQYGVLLSNGRPDSFDPDALRAAWDQRRRDAEEAEAKRHARAAARYQRVWNNAAPAKASHGYLKKKKIPPGDLRQIGKRLIVPMRGLGDGEGVMSLQMIYADGYKRFAKGGRSARVRYTLGAHLFKPDSVVYVAEGLATGATIFAVAKAPVIVAFSARNLLDVAAYLRAKYPTAKVVIAADNDRWSANNPGVLAARSAAASVDRIEYAIPDFKKLDDKPTDYNDLFAAEGAEAVRTWLDPAKAIAARTVVLDESVLPPPPPVTNGAAPSANGVVPPWLADERFWPLGFVGDTYFYLANEKGTTVEISVGAHKKDQLQQLAEMAWWAAHWPKKKDDGVNWDAARDALFRWSHRMGVFDANRRRGRGVWPEAGGHVIHLGDRLLVPGVADPVKPDAYKSPDGFIYDRLAKIVGPAETAMEAEEAATLLAVFQGPRWRDPASGYLLAGWTVLAPLCGALPWRPHVWVTGERGLGKTHLIEHLVQPLLGGMRDFVTGVTTEPGLRQALKLDALPILFDEAEEDEVAGKRIQSILGLARASSSETNARVLKGSAHGESMTFRTRSMFCLASINSALYTEADKSRVSLLALRGNAVSRQTPEEKAETQAHWRALEPRIEAITESVGRRLVARTLAFLRSGSLLAAVKVFRRAATLVLPDQRTADQYGTLYAGAWLLMSDDVPSESDALEVLRTDDLEAYQTDQQPEGIKVLRMILQQVERVETKGGVRSLSVGQLLEIVEGRLGEVSYDEADNKLRQCGIRIQGGSLVIATTSEWLTDRFRLTIYQRGTWGPLRGLPGAEAHGDVRFGGWKSRATKIPLSVVAEVMG